MVRFGTISSGPISVQAIRLGVFLVLFALNVTWINAQSAPESNPRGDTARSAVPSLRDRQAADGLLKRARTALADGNLELAEWYVQAAERLPINYGSVIYRLADTPQRVRAEMDRIRASRVPRPGNVKSSPELPPDVSSLPAPRSLPDRSDPSLPAQMNLGMGSTPQPDVSSASREVRGDGSLNDSPESGQPGELDFYAKIVDPAGQKAVQIRGNDNLLHTSPNQPILPGEVASSHLLQRAATMRGNLAPGSSSVVNPPSNNHDWSVQRARAVSYLAEARAALDRNDLALAEDFARAAQALRVPDSAYLPGDPRPWMLLLEISQRLHRADGSMLALEGTSQIQPPRIPGYLEDPLVLGPDGLMSPSVAAPPSAPHAPIPSHPADPRYAQGAEGGITQQVPANYQAASPNSLASAVPSAAPSPPVPQAQAIPSYLPPQAQTINPADYPSTGKPALVTIAPTAHDQALPSSRGPVPASMPPMSVQPVTEPAPLSIEATSPAPSISGGQAGMAQSAAPLEVTDQDQHDRSPNLRQAQRQLPSGGPNGPAESRAPSPQSPPAARSDVSAGNPHTAANNSVASPMVGQQTGEAPQGPPAGGRIREPSRMPPERDIDLPPLTAPAPKVVTDTAEDLEAARRGIELFQAGQRALRDQQSDRALSFFKRAWQLRESLDPTMQQQLQDHLQSLSAVSRQASNTDSASSAESKSVPENSNELVKQLLTQVAREQAAARALKENDPTAAWEQLKRLQRMIAAADVDEKIRNQIAARVDREMRELEMYISQNRAKLETEARNKAILEEIERERVQRMRNEQLLAELVEQFNTLMEQQRYSEAVVVAKRAREIAPHSEVVTSMIEKGRVARQVVTGMLRREKFQDAALMALNDIDDAKIPVQGDIEFPEARYWNELTRERRRQNERNGRQYNEAELAIFNALRKSITVHFQDEPLAVVLGKLAQEAGINLYLDPEGLTAEGITSSTTVSLNLPKPISLKSALNLILEPLHLAYVVQDEVLRVTSEDVRRGKVYQVSYKVADLVLQIPNFVPNNNVGLPGALREAHSLLGQGMLGGVVNQAPLTMMANNGAQTPPQGNASVLAQMASAGIAGIPGIPSGPVVGPSVSNDGAKGGGALVDFDTLINLITTTIAPDSWEANGGVGTLAPFPTNLTLVVSNTQEIHEQIVDLLQQLRRLQDLQITIEVRFITLNDNFFERIGVDFDFDLDDNTGLTRTQVAALDDDGPSVTVGLDPGGITPDLDIRFRQGGFEEAIPAFGGFQAGSAATIGFAILSDIEAFFLITATQGDTRTNVLQAPKVTLYDGQTASVSDVSQRPFVTSVIPVVGDFAAAHQPVITVLTEGTTLSVQAVCSNDRRFVRLTLVPFFSRIGDVEEFTFEGRIDSNTGTTVTDPTDETRTVRNNQRLLREGTTVQLPTLAFTSVSTTVSVPDGGTILLGGIKRLSEGRNERGVPMLSKVPYVNRLFRNVGIGRETQSLMLMVTPRIIIHEEEEQKLGTASP